MKSVKRLAVFSVLFFLAGQFFGLLAGEADLNMGLIASSFYGQYNEGKDTAGKSIPAYMDSWSEFILVAKASKGPVSAKLQFKSRTENGQRNETSDMFRVSAKSLQYTGMGKKLAVEVGTVNTAVPLNYRNGLISGTLPAKDGGNDLFLNSSDGLKLEYYIARQKGKIIRLRAASYTCNTVSHPTCGTPGSYYLSGTNATNATISDGKPQKPGSSTALSAFTVFGSLTVKAAQTNGVDDDHTAGYTKLNASKTYLGIQYAVTPSISVYVGMNALKMEKGTDKNSLYSDLPLTVTLKNLGPGKLTATYNTLARSLEGDGYSTTIKDKNDVKTVYQNLNYDIPLGKAVGVQLVYNTSTKTPKTGDTNTQSFIGGGLYGKF